MSAPFAPYADRYVDLAGPGDQRPTALEVVQDNDLVGKWAGKVCFVTGGTAGIGVETVRALHATGADVYFTARDPGKGSATRKDILDRSSGQGILDVISMNMDSLESVRDAARVFLGKSNGRLNVLVNNAGIMATPESRTKDGFERQFGVNHLAHFLLTSLLLPALKASSTLEFNSRVICVSSAAHQFSSVVFDDYNLTGKPEAYQPWKAYGQAKTANIWMANYLDRKFGPEGVHALSLHPGEIWSGLQAYVDEDEMAKWKADPTLAKKMMSTEQGAATSVWAAVGNVWEGKGGEYLAQCGIAPVTENLGAAFLSGAAPWVKDPAAEERLWVLSGQLVQGFLGE